MAVPEAHMGMEVYLTDTEGIGGRMRAFPEDFVVEELPLLPPQNEEGEYVIARVQARNWENNRLMDVLSRHLGISRNDIGFAGTKDKRAVSSQYMSFKITEWKPELVDLSGLLIDREYRSVKPLTMGSLLGNEFSIVVRDLAAGAEEVDDRACSVWAAIQETGGFPNFFGIQRFGALRPITHLVGRAIARGDFEEGVMLYLGRPMDDEGDEAMEARRYLDETRDYAGAVERYPPALWLERRLAQDMARGRSPEDALARMPRNLLMMFVHAYQGFIFNKALSRRLKAGHPIGEPMEGDVILPVDRNGLPDQKSGILATGRNLEKVRAKAAEGKCFVSGGVFGSETRFENSAMGEIERQVVEEEGIEAADFIIPKIPRISSKGTRRSLVARVKGFECSMDEVFRASFTLNKGSYATCLMREFMKAGVLCQPDHLLDVGDKGKVLDYLHLGSGVDASGRDVLEHVPGLVFLHHLVQLPLIDLVALVGRERELVVHPCNGEERAVVDYGLAVLAAWVAWVPGVEASVYHGHYRDPERV